MKNKIYPNVKYSRTGFFYSINMIGALLILSLVFNANAQNYMISFAGTGASTKVDSVKVENLTQSTSLTIKGTDILHLTGVNGINNINISNDYVQLYPNPMQGQTELLFYAKQAGNTQISVYDVSGKELTRVNNILLQGTQRYRITGLFQGLYFLNIIGETYIYTARLISQNSTQSSMKLEYMGNEKHESESRILKNVEATVNMYYKTGDGILFTGYSGIYDTTVFNIPASSKTITFTFLGLPVITTTAITAVTDTSAVSGGNITSDGGRTIISRGVCWSTLENPDLSDSFTSDGTGTGSFISFMNGLSPNITYYVRAYATSSAGTVYGNNESFKTFAGLPILTTNAVSNITDSSATSGGNITYDGGDIITSRGVCWGMSTNPTISDSITKDGTGTGSFVSDIFGLIPNTIYYVRAYASNSAGTGYGNSRSFKTLKAGTIADVDGNVYDTVHIGSQIWLKQNLKVIHYRNGDPIPNVTGNSQWQNQTKGAYCDYNNDTAYRAVYGNLYNFFAVIDTRKICPLGWHVPFDGEWAALVSYLGGDVIAGGKLKETGYVHWNSPNTGATNASGFSALPAGNRNLYGVFNYIGTLTYIWTSTENLTSYGWSYRLSSSNANVGRNYDWKPDGFSVRCLKD